MSDLLTIEVPLPPRGLSSNGSHGHWSGKARAARGYREMCAVLYADARNRHHWQPPEKAEVDYVFGIKGARTAGLYCPRDESNALASFKAGQDALTDAGIIRDDSRKHLQLGRVQILPTMGPFVLVQVRPCEGGRK